MQLSPQEWVAQYIRFHLVSILRRERLHRVNFFFRAVIVLLVVAVPSPDNAFSFAVRDRCRNKSRTGSSAGFFPNYSAEQEELGAARANPA